MIGSPVPPNRLLQMEQALIPEELKKSLEAKALLEYYRQSQARKQHKNRQQIDERLRQIENRQRSQLYQQLEMQKIKIAKQNSKKQYSRQYDQMMLLHKAKEQQLKNRVIDFEQSMLHRSSWLRDPSEQRTAEKMKRLEYGKELQKHLKMQQERRVKEALKIMQQRQKLKKQSQDSFKQAQADMEAKNKRKSAFEHRVNSNSGAKQALTWSVDLGDDAERKPQREVLTPRMDRLLKVQEQQYYGKSLQVQYKSQRQKRYFQSQNPEQISYSLQQNYNPITNPIQYKYKNPNILKLLSKYG